MKYTAEEVRAIAKRLHDDITVADGDALMAFDMLIAYAECIKADEDALPASLEQFREAIVFACVNGNADKWRRVLASFDSFAYRYKRSCTPPAQSAQSVDVEAIREVIEDMECSSLSEEWIQPNRWAERLAAALPESKP